MKKSKYVLSIGLIMFWDIFLMMINAQANSSVPGDQLVKILASGQLNSSEWHTCYTDRNIYLWNKAHAVKGYNLKNYPHTTWDYACEITHSITAMFYESSTCATLCISLVGTYKNIMQKVFGLLSQYEYQSCKSKKLTIDADDSDENRIVKTLY